MANKRPAEELVSYSNAERTFDALLLPLNPGDMGPGYPAYRAWQVIYMGSMYKIRPQYCAQILLCKWEYLLERDAPNPARRLRIFVEFTQPVTYRFVTRIFPFGNVMPGIDLQGDRLLSRFECLAWVEEDYTERLRGPYLYDPMHAVVADRTYALEYSNAAYMDGMQHYPIPYHNAYGINIGAQVAGSPVLQQPTLVELFSQHPVTGECPGNK